MWLFTPIGFFSAVAKQSDPTQVKVRARVREDLENLVGRLEWLADPTEFEEIAIFETKQRDYPYRIFISKELWGAVVADLALTIDYTNFKNQVAQVQGYDRSHLYGNVWSVMYNAEDKLRNKHGRHKRQPRIDFQ